ncbi:transposase [Streptomyces sp. NPDC046925]|uniref:transposase n=1 Tax=Streptomyces sp. NPDC046925 TaxID=3155375 RepID=UPI0033C8C389
MSTSTGAARGLRGGFDDLFDSLAQRRGFRQYLTELLAPRERNKTLTCLAGAEPVAGAQHPAVQRLQFFPSESPWEHERVNARRLERLRGDPRTSPHTGGVLVIDDSGDPKDGTATSNVGRQWLGRYGKTDNAVVTVTTLWADERLRCPLRPPTTSSGAAAIPAPAPSGASPLPWPSRPARPGFPSGRRWPTAPTGTWMTSAANCTPRTCRS